MPRKKTNMACPVPRKKIKTEIKTEPEEVKIEPLPEVEVALDQLKHESSEDERYSYWSDDEDDLVLSDFSDPDYYPYDRSDNEFSPEENDNEEPTEEPNKEPTEEPKSKSPKKKSAKTVAQTSEKAAKAKDNATDKTPVKAKGKTKKAKDQNGAIVEEEMTEATEKTNGEATTPKKGKTAAKKADKKADETPDVQKNGKDNANKSKDPELRWHTRFERDVKPEKLSFYPVRPVGPAVDLHGNWTPLSLFQLYFSSSVVRTIINNTNKKATLHKDLVNVHSWNDFWRKIWPYNFQYPGDTMTRSRFETILAWLHLCDPAEDEKNDSKRGTPEYDKLFKLKPLYTDILNSCKAHFQPNQNISIDERMVATKARIGFKQYVKNKPTKWGYKLYVLADSLTGYTWNFFIYTGKSTDARDSSLGYSSVLSLMPLSLLGSGYNLYVDNFYTSPRLFQYLHSKNIACCGTLRRHTKGIPKTHANDFPKKPERGDMRWLRKDNLLFVKWLDTREVALCSTIHTAYSGLTIKRTIRTGSEWAKKQVPCPDAVIDYNKNMGGVDLSDALIGYYKSHRKTKKWYKTLFFHFVDIAIVNGFLLYKELAKMKGEGSTKMNQKTFREILCKEMLTYAMGVEPEVEKPTVITLSCMPMYYSENGTNGRKNCRNCRENGLSRKTGVYCRSCEVSLCLVAHRVCFTEWHDKHKKSLCKPSAKKSLSL
ncbi:hypothetical protein WMY93_028402 [Mugilogobius chulae]|uniref:PiggyBac transposable element-derived protein domain-containing protein n=1 Tax=Mugilogobius chulae TaxID=88201 RepID=A0AAW0N0F9_9GOBI